MWAGGGTGHGQGCDHLQSVKKGKFRETAALLFSWSFGELAFDAMETAIDLDDQVHLVASLIAPVPQGGGGTLPVAPSQPLANDMVFPKGTGKGADPYGIGRLKAHEPGGKTAVGKVELWGFGQPFPKGTVIGFQEKNKVRGGKDTDPLPGGN
jgi:hypothetical protein